MTDATAVIDPQHAADLFESADGESAGPFTRVGTQHIRDSRWASINWLVVSDEDGQEWGLQYEDGLTENQDGTYPWETASDKPLPLTRLYPHQVTRTEYRTKPDGGARLT